MKKIDIYEPYVNFRCQKLRASMRKMAQSDWSRCSPNWLSNLLCLVIGDCITEEAVVLEKRLLQKE